MRFCCAYFPFNISSLSHSWLGYFCSNRSRSSILLKRGNPKSDKSVDRIEYQSLSCEFHISFEKSLDYKPVGYPTAVRLYPKPKIIHLSLFSYQHKVPRVIVRVSVLIILRDEELPLQTFAIINLKIQEQLTKGCVRSDPKQARQLRRYLFPGKQRQTCRTPQHEACLALHAAGS